MRRCPATPSTWRAERGARAPAYRRAQKRWAGQHEDSQGWPKGSVGSGAVLPRCCIPLYLASPRRLPPAGASNSPARSSHGLRHSHLSACCVVSPFRAGCPRDRSREWHGA